MKHFIVALYRFATPTVRCQGKPTGFPTSRHQVTSDVKVWSPYLNWFWNYPKKANRFLSESMKHFIVALYRFATPTVRCQGKPTGFPTSRHQVTCDVKVWSPYLNWFWNYPKKANRFLSESMKHFIVALYRFATPMVRYQEKLTGFPTSRHQVTCDVKVWSPYLNWFWNYPKKANRFLSESMKHFIVALYRFATPTVRCQGKPSWFPTSRHQVTCDVKVWSPYLNWFWNYPKKANRFLSESMKHFIVALYRFATPTVRCQGKPSWFPTSRHQVTCDVKVWSPYLNWFWNYPKKANRFLSESMEHFIVALYRFATPMVRYQGKRTGFPTSRHQVTCDVKVWSPYLNWFWNYPKKTNRFLSERMKPFIVALYRVATPTVSCQGKPSWFPTSRHQVTCDVKVWSPYLNWFWNYPKKANRFLSESMKHFIVALYRFATPMVRCQGKPTGFPTSRHQVTCDVKVWSPYLNWFWNYPKKANRFLSKSMEHFIVALYRFATPTVRYQGKPSWFPTSRHQVTCDVKVWSPYLNWFWNYPKKANRFLSESMEHFIVALYWVATPTVRCQGKPSWFPTSRHQVTCDVKVWSPYLNWFWNYPKKANRFLSERMKPFIVALYRVATPTVSCQGKPSWFPTSRHQVTCDVKVWSPYLNWFWNYPKKANRFLSESMEHFIVALYWVATPTVRCQGKPSWFPTSRHQVTCDVKVWSPYLNWFWNYPKKANRFLSERMKPFIVALYRVATPTVSCQGKPSWFPTSRHQVTCDVKVWSPYLNWFWNYPKKANRFLSESMKHFIVALYRFATPTVCCQGKPSWFPTSRHQVTCDVKVWSPYLNWFWNYPKKANRFLSERMKPFIVALYRVATPTVSC